jgi:NAD(P)-dependent dehydrogenase (short-subunit alcohol dehydrogenase family)
MNRLPRTPSFRLDGRRALVTGAGRGIGLACAAALAEAGAEMVLTARGREEIEAAAEAIRAAGGKAEAAVLDVTDVAATAAFVAERGPFRVLVNNAGTNRPAPLLEVIEEDYDAVAGLNVKAALFVAQAVARGLVEAGLEGSIVNVSSQMGHVGGQKRTVYCATKHAVEGFTKAMALELGPHRIRVNTLCPTFIRTAMTEATFRDPAMRAMIEEKIALGRVGTLEDVMGAIVFLASDASALMTGSALMLDGGWTAG